MKAATPLGKVNATPEAPQALVEAYLTGKVAKGRQQLRSLLEAPDMRRAWPMLSSRISSRPGWSALWGAISWALSASKRAERSKTDIRDDLEGIQKDTQRLLKRLGRLRWQDRLIYECLSADFMSEVLPAPVDWDQMDSHQRAVAADSAFGFWPTLDEVLAGLRQQAEVAVSGLPKEPRLVQRAHKATARRLRFIRILNSELVNLEQTNWRNGITSSPAAGLSKRQRFRLIVAIGSVLLGDPLTETMLENALGSPKKRRIKK